MKNTIENVYLKNVAVAVEPVDPIFSKNQSFETFANTIKKFQEYGLLPPVILTSMIHQSVYMVPTAWYYENEDRYAYELRDNIERACENKFNFRSIHVLKAKSSSNRFLIEQLSNYLKRIKSSLLIVLSSNSRGFPYWLLGSFAETAAFSASTPVLVIKPQAKKLAFSSKVRLTVALDEVASYSSKQLEWIADIAHMSKAHVDLISVKPSHQGILSSLRKPVKSSFSDKNLKSFEKFLLKKGISTSLRVVKEKESIAQTIVDFAEKTKSWVIITISTDRKFMRRVLLGSTSRRILAITKRPFLSLRLGE